ncbi:MAG: hypothetical protein C0615_10545 [Desulfuromonas sp.]|nr:MAG: hypothetical protein C0615_10545 [Desulfuromonas sp.]
MIGTVRLIAMGFVMPVIRVFTTRGMIVVGAILIAVVLPEPGVRDAMMEMVQVLWRSVFTARIRPTRFSTASV